MDEIKERNIIVTGFGPFQNHTINASWQAVKALAKTSSEELKKRYKINLIIEEIPVIYDHVTDRIPQLWKEYNPLFVIHVGVSNLACCLTIEKIAHNMGYDREDVCQKCPKMNDNEQCRALETEIDVENLCNILNESRICSFSVSHNAGRYLCEYTYYQSLCIGRNQTLFVHVPESKICSIDVTARGLYLIICQLLQTSSKNCLNNMKLEVEKNK
ncbi:hypothetical protein PV327_008407 [Microctonus hyperodae]|uniref:Pyroglutamyl-peptidase 1 n=1 Tax=Microctonus hyperodae TaxID=165561 RepID=A0AA39F330_MICHY|nr:hypothetical protein PV327_008407 [Microctonus hyperodae]